ncbi:hypothetical protein G6O67_000961 [Ophiocordyceps sinensis]|uniref:Uncharacterized protein n=1 Tax=Ophiocordyceps sinensis TaxID=72228 RepID=A0A8H4PWJ2_9HYPO|nr:hypothetical protein G6O67_000961 [Ophiocordyceps sinensis]
MLSLFSLVLVLAVAPLSLAVSPLQQRDAAAPFVEPDADSVLEVLARDAQAARGSCYVTGNRKSRPNSCSAATCVPREHCRPSSKGRCARYKGT